MGLLDGLKENILDKTDLDEKLKEKTGIDLNAINVNDEQIEKIKKMALEYKDKIKPEELKAIAAKAGVSEGIVEKVVGMLQK